MSTLPLTSFTWNTLQISKYFQFKFGDKLYRYAEPTVFTTIVAGADVTLNDLNSAVYYIFGNTVFVTISANVTPANTIFVLNGLPFVSSTGTTYYGTATLDGVFNDIALVTLGGNSSSLALTCSPGLPTPAAYELVINLFYKIDPQN